MNQDISRKIKLLFIFYLFFAPLYSQDLKILNKFPKVIEWRNTLFLDSLDNAEFDFMDDDILREDFYETYLPQKLVFSNQYRHPIEEVVLPSGLITYSKEIFEDIKQTLKRYPKFYNKIKNVQFKVINGNNPPLDLAFGPNKIIMTSGLMRSLFYLSIADFEFNLKDDTKTQIDEPWLYASLFYVRFYGTLSFMLHHELAHIYLKKGRKIFRNPKKHQKMEEKCDCFALSLFQSSIQKDLYVKWDAEGSIISYLVLMKSIINLGEKSLWGIDDETSIRKRIKIMDENFPSLIKKCERKINRFKR